MVKKIPLRPSCIKKTPPPGPLINSCFSNHQKIRGKIAFSAFRGFCFLAHFSVFSILHLVAAHELSSKIFPLLRGGQKTGENKGFFLLVSWQFFWCWCSSMWCPYARVSLDAPSSLQMCHLSLLSYFILLFSFCFPLCFFVLCFLLFDIHHFNGPAPMTKNMNKPLKTPMSEMFVFDVLLWGLHPHTFSHGPHNNRNPKPSAPANRICLLHNALNPVLKCLFYSVFQTSPKFAPKSAL